METDFERVLAKAERIVPLLSHLAQIGLFLLTAWGLFFTVIPLYQKASVDEQVAKQQRQLTSLENRMRENYVKNRRLIVTQFSIVAGPQCSGLMTPVREEPKPGDKDFYSEALGLDVGQCLTDQLQGFPPLKDLTKQDREALAMRVHEIGERIDTARLAASARSGALNTVGSPRGPVALGKNGWQTLAAMKMLGASAGQVADAKRSMSIEQQRGALVNDYLARYRTEMVNLQNVHWPPVAISE